MRPTWQIEEVVEETWHASIDGGRFWHEIAASIGGRGLSVDPAWLERCLRWHPPRVRPSEKRIARATGMARYGAVEVRYVPPPEERPIRFWRVMLEARFAGGAIALRREAELNSGDGWCRIHTPIPGRYELTITERVAAPAVGETTRLSLVIDGDTHVVAGDGERFTIAA